MNDIQKVIKTKKIKENGSILYSARCPICTASIKENDEINECQRSIDSEGHPQIVFYFGCDNCNTLFNVIFRNPRAYPVVVMDSNGSELWSI